LFLRWFRNHGRGIDLDLDVDEDDVARCLCIFTPMIEASLHERVGGTQEHKISFLSINLPIIYVIKINLRFPIEDTIYIRENGGAIYKTEGRGTLSGSCHILSKEDVDTCPHLDGWLADPAAGQPSG